MDVQEIFSALKYNTGVFPLQAVQEAMAIPDQITPLLLKVLAEAGRLPPELDDDAYMAHIYAMYLLAQFREKQAYPLIVDFFSLPDPIIMDSTGDLVTEDLHRILASAAHGDTALIKSLVENDDVNEYIRGAGLRALLMQMVQGQLTREELVAYYQSLFRGGLKRESSHFWDNLVDCCMDLFPEETIDDIRQAYDEDLVNSGYVGFNEVEEVLRRNKESVLQKLYKNKQNRWIENTAEEMSWWDCFNRSKRTHPKPVYEIKPVVPKIKIGRNDPCPCGSGKKYKKCCGK
jgi:uncharacterized protein YchJ